MGLDQQAYNAVFSEVKKEFRTRFGCDWDPLNPVQCLHFGRIEHELAMKHEQQSGLEKLEARLRALEDKFNVNGAFRGAGVSMPKHGVGAKGFNVFDEDTGFFHEGTDLPQFRFEGRRLAFRKGILVDLDKKVY